MESMRLPWLDVQEQARSLASFAELLQGIGHALRNMPTFGEDLSAALRLDLGDWRDPITWRAEVLADMGARSDFYAGLGFNHALTDFPAPAFQESLWTSPGCAGNRRRSLTCTGSRYRAPVIQGFERTNKAHGWLLRLETQLRAFIDE